MAALDFHEAQRRAAERLGLRPTVRKVRSDRGKRRIDPRIAAIVYELFTVHDQPPLGELLDSLRARCRKPRLVPPSRATVYQLMATAPTRTRDIAALPEPVQRALYNLASDGRVSEAQLAFHCFNYGDLAAASFAAGLPWLALYQADRMRGWRDKSKGLLASARRVRGRGFDRAP